MCTPYTTHSHSVLIQLNPGKANSRQTLKRAHTLSHTLAHTHTHAHTHSRAHILAEETMSPMLLVRDMCVFEWRPSRANVLSGLLLLLLRVDSDDDRWWFDDARAAPEAETAGTVCCSP